MEGIIYQYNHFPMSGVAPTANMYGPAEPSRSTQKLQHAMPLKIGTIYPSTEQATPQYTDRFASPSDTREPQGNLKQERVTRAKSSVPYGPGNRHKSFNNTAEQDWYSGRLVLSPRQQQRKQVRPRYADRVALPSKGCEAEEYNERFALSPPERQKTHFGPHYSERLALSSDDREAGAYDDQECAPRPSRMRVSAQRRPTTERTKTASYRVSKRTKQKGPKRHSGAKTCKEIPTMTKEMTRKEIKRIARQAWRYIREIQTTVESSKPKKSRQTSPSKPKQREPESQSSKSQGPASTTQSGSTFQLGSDYDSEDNDTVPNPRTRSRSRRPELESAHDRK